ncbi:hypothetical protein CIHG_00995 [Coccidioides immitis H538.4]|uniref:Uncharacterized protein n=1 Tax=Coccidioides immitis H538.4 TaxID=396776 RepID=A0A0J8U851_COCIT|nr:hypothetical protein CIHG_00995 [Coccidioides immitis H538.4]
MPEQTGGDRRPPKSMTSRRSGDGDQSRGRSAEWRCRGEEASLEDRTGKRVRLNSSVPLRFLPDGRPVQVLVSPNTGHSRNIKSSYFSYNAPPSRAPQAGGALRPSLSRVPTWGFLQTIPEEPPHCRIHHEDTKELGPKSGQRPRHWTDIIEMSTVLVWS